jgi:hypothetical protein
MLLSCLGLGATDTDESLILKTDDERCHKETGAKRETGVRRRCEKLSLKMIEGLRMLQHRTNVYVIFYVESHI